MRGGWTGSVAWTRYIISWISSKASQSANIIIQIISWANIANATSTNKNFMLWRITSKTIWRQRTIASEARGIAYHNMNNNLSNSPSISISISPDDHANWITTVRKPVIYNVDMIMIVSTAEILPNHIR